MIQVDINITRLRPLNGLELPKTTFNFKELGDLLYYEGPLLSHLSNENNEDFLIKWCDKDEIHHRWMIFKTNLPLLHQFFNHHLNLLDLLDQSPDHFVYFVDMAGGGELIKYFIVAIKDVPAEYLPLTNSWFRDTKFEPYAHEFKSYLDYHFARQEKLYEMKVDSVHYAMEPPSPYGAKK